MARYGRVALAGLLILWTTGCSDDDSVGNNNPGDAGVTDAEPDAEVIPPAVGDPCWIDDDCPDQGTCLTSTDGFPNGYCVITDCTQGRCPEGAVCESVNGVDLCVRACTRNSECRWQEGYECADYDDICLPGEGTVPVGGSCGSDSQCEGGNDALCIQQEGFIGGYCIITDCTVGQCPVGSHCSQVLTNDGWACIPSCEEPGECREGYTCMDNPGSDWDAACFPGCEDDEDCPGDFGCRWNEHFDQDQCLDVSQECTPENHTGDCPPGEVCNAGVCGPFACNDTVLEPNETQGAAQTLPTEDTHGLQICAGDHDWFTFTPTQADTLYLVGIDSSYAAGNLDVELTVDGTDEFDDARFDPTMYHDENPVGPLNLQVFALMGAAGHDTSWLHVFGVSGAENNYGLVMRPIDWQDGPDCEAVYSAQECRAQSGGGSHDPSRLIVFPWSHSGDTFAPSSVFFKNGLEPFGNPPFIASATRWGRRELIMIVRNAIHTVQQEYPGTPPLGIGEVSMPDGTTPSGHPNGTHYYGANIDVSYYIDAQYLGTAGNKCYRQICCDADDDDWACVNRDTGSTEYGTCVAGSQNTHIVDLERTALFIAKVAGSGRVRVIGMEAKIRDHLENTLDDLDTAGTITANEHAAASARMVDATDDGSWVWHFNHMHISFCTDECASFKDGGPVQGLWPDLPLADQAALARHHWMQTHPL